MASGTADRANDASRIPAARTAPASGWVAAGIAARAGGAPQDRFGAALTAAWAREDATARPHETAGRGRGDPARAEARRGHPAPLRADDRTAAGGTECEPSGRPTGGARVATGRRDDPGRDRPEKAGSPNADRAVRAPPDAPGAAAARGDGPAGDGGATEAEAEAGATGTDAAHPIPETREAAGPAARDAGPAGTTAAPAAPTGVPAAFAGSIAGAAGAEAVEGEAADADQSPGTVRVEGNVTAAGGPVGGTAAPSPAAGGASGGGVTGAPAPGSTTDPGKVATAGRASTGGGRPGAAAAGEDFLAALADAGQGSGGASATGALQGAAPAGSPAAPDPAAGLASAHAATPGGPATAAAPAPPAQATPAVPIGQVPMTIGLRSLAGSSEFQIRLDPAELGRIEVKLEIDKARGTVTTHLVVDRPETLALLQRDAGQLQQALSQTGLDPSGGGLNLSLRGDDGARGDPSGGGRDGSPRGGTPWRRDAAEAQPEALPTHRLRGYGGLDIRI